MSSPPPTTTPTTFVHDVATRPAVTCAADTPVDQVARLLLEQEVGATVVVDDRRRPLGIITDRDLMARVVAQGLAGGTAASEVMSADPVTVRDDRTAEEAARQMAVRGCRRLPVVDEEGRLCGIVTFDDLFEAIESALEQLALTVVHQRHPHLRSVA